MNQLIDDKWVDQVSAAYGWSKLSQLEVLGGTAARTFAFEVNQKKFVVRARPQEFSGPEQIEFDHHILRRWADAGLPVPHPQRQSNGTSWVEHQGVVYEVMSWADGTPFVEGDLDAIKSVGQMLGTLHRTPVGDMPSGKEGFLREDHPQLLWPYLEGLLERRVSSEETKALHEIKNLLREIETAWVERPYEDLPSAIIHGDLHPGNVRFRNSRVSALYDFDYLSRQARARDVCDGLMFFAAKRPMELNANDIDSLTQVFQIEFDWARALLEGYQENISFTKNEWKVLPLLIRSRWLQIRLRGSRKVEESRKVEFVLDRFFDVIRWLDKEANNFFTAIVG